MGAVRLARDAVAVVDPSDLQDQEEARVAQRGARASGPGAFLPRIGAVAGFLVWVLALASAIPVASDPTGVLGAIELAGTPLLLLLMAVWTNGVYYLQKRLTAWRDPTARRWQMAAYGLCLVGVLAALTLATASVITGSSRLALFGTALDVPYRIAMVWYSASILLFAVVAMRAGVLPAGAMALWAIGLTQMTFSAQPGALLLLAGLTWSGVVMWRRAPLEAPAAGVQDLPAASAGRRLLSLDALRGLIMVAMAIDHMRMMLMAHPLEIWYAALPAYDGAGAFLTRFVTHFCAPGFFFLMGAGMVLFAEARGKAGWNRRRIAGHWMLRGVLLVVVDQLVINPVLNGQPTPFFHQVLTGLGGAMLVGALLLWLRAWHLALLGGTIVLANQVLPSALVDWQVQLTPLIRFLLVPGDAGRWFFAYSLFGWLGVALLGMAFGRAWLTHGRRVFSWALIGGLLALPLFVLVRLGGGLGNIRPIKGEGWIAFLNVVKYPPSLALLLLTLGMLGIALYLLERAGPALERWGKPLLVFGRTALLFYVTHIFIYKVLQIMWTGAKGVTGVTLPNMYVGWAAGLLLLYPVCLLYGEFKRRRPTGSIWRLF